MVIIFRDFLMFDQIFLSPQVKQSVIINKKHGMYVLHSVLLNNLKVKVFFPLKPKIVSNILLIVSANSSWQINLLQTPLNMTCLTILLTLRSLTQLFPKIRATNLQKSGAVNKDIKGMRKFCRQLWS